MSNERSETEPLFKKLVTVDEILGVAREQGYRNAMWEVHCAWDVDSDDVRRLVIYHRDQASYLEPIGDKIWLIREAVRMVYLWGKLGDLTRFPLATLAANCDPRYENVSSFWKWCVAPSFSEPGKIRYTPSAEYGKADRQVVTTLGKFLTKHYPKLGAEAIRDWANRFTGLSLPIKLRFADTPNEVEEVYTNGPGSCMAGEGHEFDSEEHPARLWGYCKDTKVAYCKEGDDITARTLVREDKKLYIRIYPECHPRFSAALEAAGYKHNINGLSGLRVPFKRQAHGRALMPYVDGISYGQMMSDGTIKLNNDGGFGVQNTNGLAYPEQEEDENCSSCSNCGARHDDSEINYSEWHECNVCPSCDDSFVTAYVRAGQQDLVRVDQCVDVLGVGWVRDDGDVFESLDLVRLSDGDVVRSHIATHLYDGDWVKSEEAVVDINGDFILKSEAVKVWTTDVDKWALKACAVEIEGVWVHEDDVTAYEKHLLEKHGQEKLPLAA